MPKLDLTEIEYQFILKQRKEEKSRQERKQKQASCKHENKRFQGTYGHNGDKWYSCRDCGYEWDE